MYHGSITSKGRGREILFFTLLFIIFTDPSHKILRRKVAKIIPSTEKAENNPNSIQYADDTLIIIKNEDQDLQNTKILLACFGLLNGSRIKCQKIYPSFTDHTKYKREELASNSDVRHKNYL